MRRDLLYADIGIVIVLVLCFGLARMKPEFPPTKSEPFRIDKQAATPAPLPGEGKVIMRVNGEPITEREFQLYVAGVPEQMQAMLNSSPQGRRIMADQIVKLKALEQQAEKMGLDKDPDIAMRLDTDRSNLLANAALQKMIGGNEAKLRAEYEKAKPRFEELDLSHILIAYQGGQAPARNGQPLTREQALQKANAISDALQHGADFARLAQQQSDDAATAQQGGHIGPVTREALRDLAAPVFALRPGEISKPVVSEYGVHIFKAGPRQTPSFEQVKPMLQQQMQQALVGEAVEKVAKNAKVYLDPKFFGPETKGSAAAPGTPKTQS
jgi:peptidyl-prolyl cis-trans isomerase C